MYNIYYLGYVQCRTQTSPQLSEADKLKRYIWCLNNKDIPLDRRLFVDETTIRVLEVPIYHMRKPSSKPAQFPLTSKIRYKVNLFGGISSKGPTEFVVSTA